MQISGAVALVTGGAKGLGFSIATRLKDMGAKVIILDRDEMALTELPNHFECHFLDVTRPDDVRPIIAATVSTHGRIDILVNNAGIIFNEPFVNIMNTPNIMHDYTRFRNCLTSNLDSVFIMTSAVVEQMVLKRTKGVIISISSISSSGNEGQTAYSAAKAAVNAMTVTWSKELGRWGIRCNAVAPGFIGTPSTIIALSETVVRHLEEKTPLRRLGVPEEIAQAVTAVIENDFMTGVVLDVNGGLII